MRKFKIKNRPKRKYVRKNTATMDFSVSKTAFTNLLPLLFATIAVFFFILVSLRAGTQFSQIITHTIVQEISIMIPTVSLPSIPAVSITLPTLPLPQHNNRPALATVTTLTRVAATSMQFTISGGKAMREVTSVGIRQMSAFTLSLAQKLIDATIILGKVSMQMEITISEYLIQEITFAYHISFSMHVHVIGAISQAIHSIGESLRQTYYICTEAVNKFWISMVHQGNQAKQKMDQERQKAAYALLTPVRATAYYLELARPTMNKIGFILKRSAIALENNAVVLFTAPTKAMEKNL